MWKLLCDFLEKWERKDRVVDVDLLVAVDLTVNALTTDWSDEEEEFLLLLRRKVGGFHRNFLLTLPFFITLTLPSSRAESEKLRSSSMTMGKSVGIDSSTSSSKIDLSTITPRSVVSLVIIDGAEDTVGMDPFATMLSIGREKEKTVRKHDSPIEVQ